MQCSLASLKFREYLAISLFQILIRACKLRNHTRDEGKKRDFPRLDPRNIITLMQEDSARLSHI